MLLLSNEHGELLETMLKSKTVETTHGHVDKDMKELEETYKKAYHVWIRDNDLAAPYKSFRAIHAKLTGKGKSEPVGLWPVHILARCLILEAREPNIGIKQIELRKEARKYANLINFEGSRGWLPSRSSHPLVPVEEGGKMK
ncbi:MAG: hypothetical protein Q9169_001221 [Polycauliona sp. 2 TL-2023]